VIKYLGSKRLLVPLLCEVVGKLVPDGTVVDLFSGTSRVGHALKRAGYRVLANDHTAYAATLARAYVQADLEDHGDDVATLLAELDALPGEAGWFTRSYCEEARFFQPKNGARAEAIREALARLGLPPEREAVALVSLLEACDRVDSTTGVQMAFLKRWAARASNDLHLRVPDLLPRAASGKGAASELDAVDAADALEGDVAYVDPPYNQHKYLGNYHVWETLVRWDRPETYGIVRKRADCRTRGSAFNSRVHARAALADVLRRVRARHVVVSFSDEGFLDRAELEGMLAERGHVAVIARPFRRYVGARIGIHNRRGEKVGTVSHVDNHELVYVATPDRAAFERMAALA
jgi:adenine-specific DNA-methyltransferase